MFLSLYTYSIIDHYLAVISVWFMEGEGVNTCGAFCFELEVHITFLTQIYELPGYTWKEIRKHLGITIIKNPKREHASWPNKSI